MGTERSVTFRIKEFTDRKGLQFEVEPQLTNIVRAENGENILLAIAANCVRMISKRSGLESAIDRFNDTIMNRTKVV